MNAKKIVRIILILTVLGLNIGCDQISKNIVRQTFDSTRRLSFLNNHITLTKVENTGAFLSMGQSLPRTFKLILLTILPIVMLVLVFLAVFTKNKLSDTTIFGLCFIIGGGIGNVFDRLAHGSVTDFLHIDFVLFHTGIFNMADVSIMTGFFVILLELYLKNTKLKAETVGKQMND